MIDEAVEFPVPKYLWKISDWICIRCCADDDRFRDPVQIVADGWCERCGVKPATLFRRRTKRES